MKTSINSDIRISKGFLDSLSDIIFVFDNQRNVLFANSVLYERLNYRSQDLIGKDISILYSPDQKYNIKEPIEKALQNEFVTINIPLISRKGHKINVNTKFFRKSWNGEKVILGVAQNPIIQAYTIFNKEDKNWKKFYKNVLNAIQDGINILDTNYENILVNSWMDKKYSFVPTLIGKKCYEVYQQRKSICPWCPCEKTFISGEMNTSVVPYPSSENPQGLLELTAYPINNERGKVIFIIEYVKDITKRVKTEQELKKSEERYRTLYQNTPIGISITDFDGNVLAMNDRMKIITGFESIDEFNRVKVSSTYKNPLERENMLKELKKNSRVRNFETILIRKNGELFNALLNIDLMEIEDEKLLLTSLEDISYLKEIESNLRSSQKQFKEAFNRAEFYKDIFAHDMNNILQNILSSLELNSLAVKENNKYQILNETYNVIKNQIKRGATLISNVRKLSEIEENDINLFKLNLLDYLEKSIKDVREIYNNKNLKLELNSFDHQIVVLANELIVDIFENLFQNAIHHNENEAKEIIINVKEVSDTKANKDFVQIEFIDNGKGIEDKRKINIFERATNGAKGVRGMGLGLSLVKKIIEIYGGEICVEDRVKNDFKKGSKFIMTLPMHLGQ